MDAALDLQFRLAGFLAEAELAEYAEDTDEGFAESKQNLVLLSHGSRARKFDA